MTLNIPVFLVSFPCAFLFHHGFPVSSQYWLSYVYAAVLAGLAIAQWLLIGRFLTWAARKLRVTFTRAT